MYIIFILIVVYMVHNGEQLIIGKNHGKNQYQWQFQEPKLEVPTIYNGYVRGYTPKMWPINQYLIGLV